jgi:CheY-like chemotaxis protein
MTSEHVRVLVVDDQAVVRDAARMMLEASPGFRPVGEAASGAEALAAIERLDPDLVLLDVRMPDMDGVETARRIQSTGRAPVVILMSTEDGGHVESCGAAAFLPKQRLKGAVLRQLWEQHGR